MVRDTLGQIQGLGDVDVTYTGDCKAFTYTVTMASKAGDQPEMTVNIFLSLLCTSTSVCNNHDLFLDICV